MFGRLRLFPKIHKKLDGIVSLIADILTAPSADGRLLSDEEIEEFYKKYPTYKDFMGSEWYKNDEWIGASIRAKQRDNCKCRDCSEPATCVHHDRNPFKYPRYMYWLPNLVSFCDKCHKEHTKKRIEAYNQNK